MTQEQYRIPKTGENWRHYKGDLYTVVGIAIDDTGGVNVVYTPWGWYQAQLPPLFVQALGRFLQEVQHNVARFTFNHEHATREGCAFIRDRQRPSFGGITTFEGPDDAPAIDGSKL